MCVIVIMYVWLKFIKFRCLLASLKPVYTGGWH